MISPDDTAVLRCEPTEDGRLRVTIYERKKKIIGAFGGGGRPGGMIYSDNAIETPLSFIEIGAKAEAELLRVLRARADATSNKT